MQLIVLFVFSYTHISAFLPPSPHFLLFPPQPPTDVDFKIMVTFVEFYTTMLGFVNFRLYHHLGVHYPPKVRSHLGVHYPPKVRSHLGVHYPLKVRSYFGVHCPPKVRSH